jgi:hypothetical protein
VRRGDSDRWRALANRAGRGCCARYWACRANHQPSAVRVYLATSSCDMRRSFDGLYALMSAVLKLDGFAGHVFVFANERRDRVTGGKSRGRNAAAAPQARAGGAQLRLRVSAPARRLQQTDPRLVGLAAAFSHTSQNHRRCRIGSENRFRPPVAISHKMTEEAEFDAQRHRCKIRCKW